MAQPGYPNSLPCSLVAERLREATSTDHHGFWPDGVGLLNPQVADWRRVMGPRQVTDAYLLALAVERQGRFVTFDARITPSTVVGANDRHLCPI